MEKDALFEHQEEVHKYVQRLKDLIAEAALHGVHLTTDGHEMIDRERIPKPENAQDIIVYRAMSAIYASENPCLLYLEERNKGRSVAYASTAFIVTERKKDPNSDNYIHAGYPFIPRITKT